MQGLQFGSSITGDLQNTVALFQGKKYGNREEWSRLCGTCMYRLVKCTCCHLKGGAKASSTKTMCKQLASEPDKRLTYDSLGDVLGSILFY